MPLENRNNLKSYFEQGDKPTQNQFSSLIDSSLNITEDKATVAEVEAGNDNNKFITPAVAKQAITIISPVKTVNGIAPVNGNIDINIGGGTGLGSLTLGVAKFYTTSQSYSEIFHIKLPYKITVDDNMYHIKAEGYVYGSADIIDIVWVGYCYPASANIIQTKTHINRSTSIIAGQYVGSDNHVYLWFKVPYTYVTTFRLDSMVVYIGTQLQPGEIEIIISDQTTL